ncbi:hypothetical protein NQ318_010011 [Aromia moschata]|uniref:AAA+ ATPase domain-containing protein n=1 Tax=Aromia moschata TaxID=1265417 RepID=A0AAV8Y8X3_9CUCU|nr:hypothetical protein NQ318_010011 [Aromia moschata]
MPLLNQKESGIGSRALRKTRSTKDVADFTKVGGLSHHLKTLREVIIFPLLHGNVFTHFKIKAPRGVLFYGPPGTGKTLMAGALATEINKEGIGKVSFFHRKGADILDKWVGESEKNLRVLFEKATKSRPSIIFFDELDGLAPIRSEKNDHIHSSVVATLLALMDGLDNKPGVIVIGATNRIEAIDPALRRPGRFDKELYFPLPGVEARKEIIEVHTNTWKQKPTPTFVCHLADVTAGFCGSDIQALCSEAVLCCLRRMFPNLETRGAKIKINAESLQNCSYSCSCSVSGPGIILVPVTVPAPGTVLLSTCFCSVPVPVSAPYLEQFQEKIEECDFLDAKLNLIPSSFKQGQKMRNLSHIVKPLLARQQNRILRYIQQLWPHFLQEGYKYTVGERRYAGRILLIGSNMQGLNTHLVPSILKHLEHLPSFIYDSRLFDRPKVTNRINVQLNFPAVIWLSRIDEWWNYIDDCDQLGIVSTLEEIHAGLPILTMASCRAEIPTRLHNFFYNNSTILVRIEDPNERERETFLAPLFFDDASLSLYGLLTGRGTNDGPHPNPAPKIIKGIDRLPHRENETRNIFTRSCRQKRRLQENVSYNFLREGGPESAPNGNYGKRKRETSRHGLLKKIKFCESKFGAFRSNSTTSLYNMHKQMKTHKHGDGNAARQCSSLTSFQSLKNKQYITRVLSDLLNQRHAISRERRASRPTASTIYGRVIKMECGTEPSTAPGTSSGRKNVTDWHMKKIYKLWKHASLTTSKDMAVAQLELLYDVISACININQNSFEDLVENLESVLRKIERSYQVTETDLQ